MAKRSRKVVVVTGASSGIGREAARLFASRGDAVVLAARRGAALAETARLCREAGGSALQVVTDVTQEQDVSRLAAAALEHYGRIDVWVNNAGVTLFAHIDEAPFDEHRRVIETNVFGAMYGARAVLPIFRRQRSGVMINVGSILSKVGQPFVPSYVVSKFALRGLTEALRTELADEPGIQACSLFPYAVDTPHFEAGANELGRHPRAMPPVQSPEKVARALVELADHPRRERHVPRIAVLGLALHWLAPRSVERLLLHALQRFHFDEQRQSRTRGNLFQSKLQASDVHGTRPPQVKTPLFFAWALRELVRIEGQFALERARQWGARASA